MSAEHLSAHQTCQCGVCLALRNCADIPSPLRQRVLALYRRLDPVTGLELLTLAWELEEAGFNRGVSTLTDYWDRTLAHFPGIAPALQLVYDHVEGSVPLCVDIKGGCTLPRHRPPDPA
jgi:hypothetical protein